VLINKMKEEFDSSLKKREEELIKEKEEITD
jgi:hypothetical protein